MRPGPPTPTMIPYLSLVTPNLNSLANDTSFNQSDWGSGLQALIDVGEEVYTINIQPTSDYLDIAALRAVGSQPAPCLLYTLSPFLPTRRNYFPKSS